MAAGLAMEVGKGHNSPDKGEKGDRSMVVRALRGEADQAQT